MEEVDLGFVEVYSTRDEKLGVSQREAGHCALQREPFEVGTEKVR